MTLKPDNTPRLQSGLWRWGFFCVATPAGLLGMTLLACAVATAAHGATEPEAPALTLGGAFEDTFAGNHHQGGAFAVRSCGSNALIDIVFENGSREISGTDGRDAFVYRPFTGQKTPGTSANGIGSIAFGRFPTNAHLIHQLLWLVCTHDPAVVTHLQAHRFPFYGDYNPQEMTPHLKAGQHPPHWATSIQWYAPGKVASGTNRYDSPMYPEGWLKADISVTTTQAAGNLALPVQVIYTQYAQRYITNRAQIRELHARRPEDVLPVEVVVFSFTNAQTDGWLSSYVPELTDQHTRVHDLRVGRVFQAGRGRSWAERDLLAQHDPNPRLPASGKKNPG